MDKPKGLLPTAGPSNVKALMLERAKAAAAIESFGSEQISKSSVSDAADIVGRVSGRHGGGRQIRRDPRADGSLQRRDAERRGIALGGSLSPLGGLDMFPAKIIDRVTVTKTFTPGPARQFHGRQH